MRVDQGIPALPKKPEEFEKSGYIGQTQRPSGKRDIMEGKALLFDILSKARITGGNLYGVTRRTQELHKGEVEVENVAIHSSKKENTLFVSAFTYRA